MELGYLESIGLSPFSAPVALLTRSGTSRTEDCSGYLQASSEGAAAAPQQDPAMIVERPGRRFFVIKSKSRENVKLSHTKGVWAFRAHTSCREGDQPHERLAAACRTSSVVLLFFENGEHAWIGHATMEHELQYEPDAAYPHIIKISWSVCLPPAQGVSFRDVSEAGDAHKIFNADEVPARVGEAICAAIDAKMKAVTAQEELAHSALLDSAFLHIVPGESIEDTNRRLVHEVEVRLGPVVVACACGSRRYNLHFPESDFDTLVVYAARDPETAIPIRKNPPSLHPDYTLVEVGRFVDMLIDGDARMVESLYLDVPSDTTSSCRAGVAPDSESAIFHYSSPWKSIALLRDEFLSRALVRKYLGDATGRAGLTMVRKGARPEKHNKILYIVFRTLQAALQACGGKRLEVWRPTGSPQHDFIMAVRRGEQGTPTELLPAAEALVEEVHRALHESALPEKANPDISSAWLSEVRRWATSVATYSER